METFSKSDKFLDEYSATVVRIGKLEPIKNSDFLAKTQVAGFDIVELNPKLDDSHTSFVIAEELLYHFLAFGLNKEKLK